MEVDQKDPEDMDYMPINMDAALAKYADKSEDRKFKDKGRRRTTVSNMTLDEYGQLPRRTGQALLPIPGQSQKYSDDRLINNGTYFGRLARPENTMNVVRGDGLTCTLPGTYLPLERPHNFHLVSRASSTVTITFGNLDPSVTAKNIVELCEVCGYVIKAEIKMDSGIPTGFATVDMASLKEAEAVIAMYKDRKLDRRPIVCYISSLPQKPSIYSRLNERIPYPPAEVIHPVYTSETSNLAGRLDMSGGPVRRRSRCSSTGSEGILKEEYLNEKKLTFEDLDAEMDEFVQSR